MRQARSSVATSKHFVSHLLNSVAVQNHGLPHRKPGSTLVHSASRNLFKIYLSLFFCHCELSPLLWLSINNISPLLESVCVDGVCVCRWVDEVLVRLMWPVLVAATLAPSGISLQNPVGCFAPVTDCYVAHCSTQQCPGSMSIHMALQLETRDTGLIAVINQPVWGVQSQ